MRLPIVLLLSLAALASAADRTNFKFSMALECTRNDMPTYRFNLQFKDRDSWFSHDDDITQQRHGEARPGTTYFSVEGWLDGDEFRSTAFDVKMILYHDCTEYGKEATLELNVLPPCEMGKGSCHYTIHKDLTDASGYGEIKVGLEYL